MTAATSARWRPRLTARIFTMSALACAVATLAATPRAHGVLPPAFGGALRLPLAAPLEDVDPARQAHPLGAAVSAAIFDTLYAIDARGALSPVLAESLPVPSTTTTGAFIITLRSALRRHDGQRLVAADVVAALRRAATMPRAAWLLGALAIGADGLLDVRAVGALQLELRPAREGVELARVLAARPLAIAVGDPRRRAIGTGAFAVRGAVGGSDHETVLVQHDAATLGAPYLERVTLLAPRARDEDLRALELGETDASWFGATLYAAPAEGSRSAAETPVVCPVLLVASETGALRDAGLRGYVLASIDRRRLERAGLSADARIAGVDVAAAPSARAPATRPTLRLAVPSGDPLLARIAESLAAMLDERGVSVIVGAAPAVDAPAAGGWDARLVSVLPPLPGAAPLIGAALAAAGRADAARALAAQLSDANAAAEAARRFDVVVLGRRRDTLHYRAALRDVRFDAALGTLELANIWLPRVVLPVAAAAVRRARGPRR